METVISNLEFYGGVAPSIYGQHAKLPGGSFAIISKEPLGVVGGVGAWNYPLQTATWKIAPALACGNTFVYKPSQLTPLSVVMLAEVSINHSEYITLVELYQRLCVYAIFAIFQSCACGAALSVGPVL